MLLIVRRGCLSGLLDCDSFFFFFFFSVFPGFLPSSPHTHQIVCQIREVNHIFNCIRASLGHARTDMPNVDGVAVEATCSVCDTISFICTSVGLLSLLFTSAKKRSLSPALATTGS